MKNDFELYKTLFGLKKFIKQRGLTPDVSDFMQLDDTYKKLFDFSSTESFITSVNIQLEGLIEWMKQRKEKRKKKKEEELLKEENKKKLADIVNTFPNDANDSGILYELYWELQDQIDLFKGDNNLEEFGDLIIPDGIVGSTISDLKNFARQYESLLKECVSKMKEFKDNDKYSEWFDKKLKSIHIKGLGIGDFGSIDYSAFTKKSTVKQLGWTDIKKLKSDLVNYYNVLNIISSLGSEFNDSWGRFNGISEEYENEFDLTREEFGAVLYNGHGLEENALIPVRPLILAIHKKNYKGKQNES